MENKCICCGADIPEGRMVCPKCEKTEQKKLTDEEILKALDICYSAPCCTSECPYFNKYGRNFCVEDKALYKDMKRIVEEHIKQKAEIERLTEENGYLDGCAKQFLADYQKCEVEVAELQKQVDELTAFKNEAISMSLYGKGRKDGEEVAVKDTAKKFAERLKARFHKSREYYEVDTGTAWSNGHIGGLINDTIDEIAKEITEGKV